ncbi:MAG TPA: S9 family peptidase [Firmicutes bacterium]|nr:S9 family peptidase [Bacillota bacterium]
MKHYSLFVALTLFSLFTAGCRSTENLLPSPPRAVREAHITEVHGYTLTDHYYWMRQKGDPRVKAYIEDENRYTERVMAGTKSLQKKLYKEMAARITENDRSVPEREGRYDYYSKNEKGKEYPIYCRKKAEEGAREEILIDVNELARGLDYFSIGLMSVSPDEMKLAYTYDINGAEEYRLAVKDLRNGAIIEERDISVPDFQWMKDSKTYLYTVNDETWRPSQLYRHSIGEDEDELLYEENDGRFWMWISESSDKSILFMGLGSKTSTEIHFLSADDLQGHLTCFSPRKQDVEYYLNAHDGYFYIFTNEQAPNFKLERTAMKEFGRSDSREAVIPHSDATLTDYYLFRNYLAYFIREEGVSALVIRSLGDQGEYRAVFPDLYNSFYPGRNKNYDSDLLRVSVSSMITPTVVYDLDMKSGDLIARKEQKVKGYDRNEYVTERVLVSARDGSEIPVIWVAKKGFSGPRPLYLYAYGAYGDYNDPYFSSTRLSLLDRGFIFAMAQVRGGGEKGIDWYKEGKLLHKKNTFYDVIDCAEFLIHSEYTTSEKLILSGGSAGGLLVGATVNMRPDLFFAAVASVPFVDVVNTMLDSTLPLTVAEYEEWGDPMNREYFDYIRSYSPYENIHNVSYPHMLIIGGLNDPRVQYWEPLKWTARLREETGGDSVILLRMNTDSGHMGTSGRYAWLKESAFEYAFILSRLGMY